MTITVEAIRQPVGRRVRDMASNDIARLVELDALLFGADAWSETAWWAELAERPRRDYVVIEDEATILAYGGLDIGTDSADVMTLAVAPEAQGQGLGRDVDQDVHAAHAPARLRRAAKKDDNRPPHASASTPPATEA